MASITLDWLHVIALLGAVQGFFLTGVLAVRQRNRTANRTLAAAILAFTIYLSYSVYHAAGLEVVFPHFFGVAHPTPLLFGPLIYLYAVTASDRSRRITKWDLLHFVPAVLTVVAALPIYLASGTEKIAFFHAAQRGVIPWTVQFATPVKLISGIVYTVITLLFLRSHRERIRNNYSTLEQVNLRWLMWLTSAAAVVWLIAVVVNVTQMLEGPASQRGENLITLGVAVVVYGIGYMALRQGEIYRFDTAEYPIAVAPQPSPNPPAVAPTVESTPVPEPSATGGRYERSGLSERESANLKKALEAAMAERRPWRSADLTLADLAKLLTTTPHKLSEVLNTQLQQTFYDFVNGYRVRDVQRRIKSDEARNLTILSLALDAGFASKSTFNDVFKKHTGKTPSDYRRSAVPG